MKRTKRGVCLFGGLKESSMLYSLEALSLVGLLLVSNVGAQDASSGDKASPKVNLQDIAVEKDMQQSLQRQEKLVLAEENFDNGMRALELEDFGNAEKYFNEALRRLNESGSIKADQVQKLQEKIQEAIVKLNLKWADSLVREARENVDAGKIDDAQSRLSRALEKTNSEALHQFIYGY